MRRRKEQREKRERKFLGFYIQLGFKAIRLEVDFRGQIPHITISLYEDPERERFVRKRETEERLSSVFLSLVFCFVFFVRFIRTDRHYI